MRNVFVLAIFLVMMQACNLSKLAQKEGAFLYKNKIAIKETRESRLFSSDIDAYVKQIPNKRILNLTRFNLRFYHLGNSFPETWLGRSIQKKIGEAPVILDSALIESSIKGITGFLKTEGYFYPEISYEVTGKIHKKQVKYIISTGKAYHIYRIEQHIADKTIDSLVQSQFELSHIRYGNPVKFENMLKEKARIADQLKDQGYYSFGKDAVAFDLDTGMQNYRAMVGINISNPEEFNKFKTYKLDHIFIEIENKETDYKLLDTTQFRKFSYKPNNYPLNPQVLGRALLVAPKQTYNQTLSTISFGRLNDLQIFRSVNMNAIPKNENTDTPSISYVIKLQPSNKYDFTIEPQAITSDQSNLVTGSSGRNYGLASQITLTDKNVFKNAEILQLSYRVSVEAQRGFNIPTVPFFNSFESNLSANLIFPKLLFLPKLDSKWNKYTNRSMVTASFIWEQNVNWIRNVYAVGFNWQKSRPYFNQYFVPAEISYIKTDFNNSSLEEQSKNDPYLQSVFNNNLVTASRYGFVFNNQGNIRKKHYTYIKWDVLELAGNIIDQAFPLLGIQSDTGFNTFMGVQYFQYAKTFADIRYNRFLDENNRLASRLAIGVAIPYGNSPEFVPFDKRFFTGGANSIRAFLPRSIGPGAYNAAGNTDRSGDVRLEFNIESRFNILNHFIEGAIFTDAGNIWRIKEDGREEAVFAFNTFYKQLAVGSGLGLRLNLDFLVVRLDAAVPIIDPRKPLNNRNVLPTYGNIGNLWNATIFNFGVGYPF
jgi:outer membrane protein assembly factor BamA